MPPLSLLLVFALGGPALPGFAADGPVAGARQDDLADLRQVTASTDPREVWVVGELVRAVAPRPPRRVVAAEERDETDRGQIALGRPGKTGPVSPPAPGLLARVPGRRARSRYPDRSPSLRC